MMSEKRFLYHRQNLLHNPAHLMSFDKPTREQFVAELKQAAKKYGHDCPGIYRNGIYLKGS